VTGKTVDELVRDALVGVLPGFDARSLVASEPLAGGLNPRSFLVEVDDRRYVVRFTAAGPPPLTDLATEARVMSAAAGAGLAPRVVGADPARGVLVTEYRGNARAWSAAQSREPRNVERAAELLRALHHVRVDAPPFAAGQVAESYFAALGAATLPHAAWAEELLRLARVYETRYAPDTLCHHDLTAENILDDGALVLVDFEYAVRGAPILDLASLAGMNDYAEPHCRQLLSAYYRDAPQVAFTELADMVRMTRLFAFFWALRGERQAADGGRYMRIVESMSRALNR
jgi:thiamine kinase-like enzyme